MESIIDKVFNIDDIFKEENVKVKAKIADNRCLGCYFNKEVWPYCYKPSYVGSCKENGIKLIFVKLKKSKIEYDKG